MKLIYLLQAPFSEQHFFVHPSSQVVHSHFSDLHLLFVQLFGFNANRELRIISFFAYHKRGGGTYQIVMSYVLPFTAVSVISLSHSPLPKSIDLS